MLRELDKDLWTAEAPFSVGLLQIGVRTNVVRLPDGGLFVHSPIALDDDLRGAIDALGPVRHLVAPNKVHHLWLADWVEAYPSAKLWGVVGLPDKKKKLRFDGVLVDERPDASWADVLDQKQFYGAPKTNEVVFLHKPTRTLLLCDLAFNICKPVNWVTRAYLRIGRAHGRLTTTAIMRGYTRDKKKARESADRILALDFDRVVVAHGDVVDGGGAEALRDAFGWL